MEKIEFPNKCPSCGVKYLKALMNQSFCYCMKCFRIFNVTALEILIAYRKKRDELKKNKPH